MNNAAEQTKTAELALGRIFRMASRPTQDGDVAEYERCRGLIMDILHPIGSAPIADNRPCYVRDRLRGAAGD